MPTQSDTGGLTVSEAEAILARAQRLMGAGDLAEVMKTFSSDVVVRFADRPETHGQHALEIFLAARFARQKNYRLRKELRAVWRNVIVCSWDCEWDDGNDGREMQGRGIELLTMRDGEIPRWEATFNVWQEGRAPSLPIV